MTQLHWKLDMKSSVILLMVLSVAGMPVYASNYYFGVASGNAAQEIQISVLDNSVDPQIPNVLTPKDYQAGELDVTTGSVFAGYRMGSDMALEAGVTRLADMSAVLRPIDTVDTDPGTSHMAEETVAVGFSYVSLLGVWPLTENLVFHIQLGVASWSFDYSQAISEINTTTQALTPVRTEAYSDSSVSGIYGAGFSYAIGEWLELSLNYDTLKIKPVFVNVEIEDSVQLFSLGMVLHF
jgi:hypothetical protein